MTASFTVRPEHAIEGETWMHAAVQMIGQREPVEILGAFCREAAAEGGSHLAFFLLEGERWTLAAPECLPAASRVALAAIDPARLSDALLKPRPAGSGRSECPFEGGWARHLFSGTGELLGILVGLANGPALSFGPFTARLESMCRIAALAIEQRNLLEELAFKAGHEGLAALFKRSYDSETSVQRITQMIARQSPPAEILGALCAHIGHSEGERQVAFFLLSGER